jgi:hypothetical protein
LAVLLAAIIVWSLALDLYAARVERTDRRIVQAVADACEDARELLDQRDRERAGQRTEGA